MSTVLPDEVLCRILHELHAVTPSQLASLALVLPTRPRQLATLARPVFTSSSSIQRYHAHVQSSDTGTGARARILTIQRGSARVPLAAAKGRRANREPVEDAVTPEDLVRLVQALKQVVDVRLVEPAFDSLRRRQVDFAANLPHLRSLSIVGRKGGSDHGFNLHTVGQILQSAPNIVDLALRGLNSHGAALVGLAQPSCRLASFALFDTPSITTDQLYWLLSESIHVDSLRTLACDIPPDVPPSHFASVKWAATPVTRLAVTSARPQVVEGVAQHFASLRHFAFRCPAPVDPHRLLASCASSGSVDVIEDRSLGAADGSCSGGGGGAEPLAWAAALVLARRRRLPSLASFRRLALGSHRRSQPGFAVLDEVCRVLGVQLETYELEREAVSQPFVPAEFAALRPLHLECDA